MDIPVTVNTRWTGPAQRTLTTRTAQPVMGSTTTYISTIMINSFGRDRSGMYSCTSVVNSLSSFLTSSDLLTGSAHLSNLTVIIMYCNYYLLSCKLYNTDVVSAPVTTPEGFSTESAAMSIQFSWSPPSLLNSTTIISSYTLTCRSEVAGVNTVMNVYPNAEIYTLGGFRPATEYNCSVFASNSAGDGPPASTSVTTMDDSELAIYVYSCT